VSQIGVLGEVLQDHGDERVPLAVERSPDDQRFSIERIAAIQVPLTGEQVASGGKLTRAQFGELSGLARDAAQPFGKERVGTFPIARPMERTGKVVQRIETFRIVGAGNRAANLEDAAAQADRLRPVSRGGAHVRQRFVAGGDFGVNLTMERATNGQRFHQQRLGFLGLAELRVNSPDHVEHLRLELGLSTQLVRSIDGATEEKVRGDGIMQRLSAFRRLEQTEHEVRDLFGLPRPRLRLDERATNARAVHQHGSDVHADERNDRGSAGERATVSSREPPQAVRRRLTSSQHGTPLEVALNVVGEILDRCVAGVRFLGERFP
jgi:hypothetical protein